MIRSDCRTTQARSSDELVLKNRKYINGSEIELSKTGDFVPVDTLDKPQQIKSCFERWKEVYDNLPSYNGFRWQYFSSVVDEPCSSGEKYISDSLEKSSNDSFVNDCVKRYGLDRGISIIIRVSFDLARPEAKTFERMCITLTIVSFATQLYAATQIKYHGYIEATSSTPIERHFKTFIAKMSDFFYLDYRIAELEREISNLTKDEILKCIKAVRNNTTFSRNYFGCNVMLKVVQNVCDDIEKVLRAELPPSISTKAEKTSRGKATYTQFVSEIIMNPRESHDEYKSYISKGIGTKPHFGQCGEWYMTWKFMALQADHEGPENHFTIICRFISVITSAFKSREKIFDSYEWKSDRTV